MSLTDSSDDESSSSLESTGGRRDQCKSPSDSLTSSNPVANDENLTPAIGSPLLPFKFRIEVGMILVVDHEKITDNTDYLEYMLIHDPDYRSLRKDIRRDDRDGSYPMYQAMEDTWGVRKEWFLQGIIELEGLLDVCFGNWCKHGYETWHVYRDHSVSLSFSSTMTISSWKGRSANTFADGLPRKV